MGRGKLQDIIELIKEYSIDTLVCDDELNPTQQRNLERALNGTKVIDRTAVILDVFASRASSKEGRLQVELAQSQYLLPRVAGQWSHLERLAGGIGTRGPGETQIEVDRRLIRRRIHRLNGDIEQVRRHRQLYRLRRSNNQIPVISLVGYTNAGKSTLLNKLTGSQVQVENRLFSTLDPVTRRMKLPRGLEVLISDTVGFVQKLPADLVAAFRATLEETTDSSLILQVVDLAHPGYYRQLLEVDRILKDLGIASKPRVIVFNKIDAVQSFKDMDVDKILQKRIQANENIVFCSASDGSGIPYLLDTVENALNLGLVSRGQNISA